MCYVEYYDKLYRRIKKKTFESTAEAIEFAKEKHGIVVSR